MTESQDHKACKKHIIRLLQKRVLSGDSINLAIKEHRYPIVFESIAMLVQDGIIAVSNKRYWIRNREKALAFLNDTLGVHNEPLGKEEWFDKAVEIVETGKVPEGIEVRRK